MAAARPRPSGKQSRAEKMTSRTRSPPERMAHSGVFRRSGIAQAGKLLNDGRRYYEGYVTGHSMQLGRFALQGAEQTLRIDQVRRARYLLEMGTGLFERARVGSSVAPMATPATPRASMTGGDPVPGTSTSSGSSAKLCATV